MNVSISRPTKPSLHKPVTQAPTNKPAHHKPAPETPSHKPVDSKPVGPHPAPGKPAIGTPGGPVCGTPSIIDPTCGGPSLGSPWWNDDTLSPWPGDVSSPGSEESEAIASRVDHAAADLWMAGRSPQVSARAMQLAQDVRVLGDNLSDRNLARIDKASTKLTEILGKLSDANLSRSQRARLERSANRLMTGMERVLQRSISPRPITPPGVEISPPWSIVDLQQLLGRKLDDIGTLPPGARVVRDGDSVAADHRPGRVTIQIDRQNTVIRSYEG